MRPAALLVPAATGEAAALDTPSPAKAPHPAAHVGRHARSTSGTPARPRRRQSAVAEKKKVALHPVARAHAWRSGTPGRPTGHRQRQQGHWPGPGPPRPPTAALGGHIHVLLPLCHVCLLRRRPLRRRVVHGGQGAAGAVPPPPRRRERPRGRRHAEAVDHSPPFRVHTTRAHERVA
eukprot:TRINITY_DN4705_c0_g1_i1.p4 TRINITY_DN4705_c0_g1~~TRINITY_DN4705_c0_g1_i1.p4  ORF type:complete len:177 (-),score=5.41 TRINITY_DN4705_c0_g1_i1:16-546(-)